MTKRIYIHLITDNLFTNIKYSATIMGHKDYLIFLYVDNDAETISFDIDNKDVKINIENKDEFLENGKQRILQSENGNYKE